MCVGKSFYSSSGFLVSVHDILWNKSIHSSALISGALVKRNWRDNIYMQTFSEDTIFFYNESSLQFSSFLFRFLDDICAGHDDKDGFEKEAETAWIKAACSDFSIFSLQLSLSWFIFFNRSVWDLFSNTTHSYREIVMHVTHIHQKLYVPVIFTTTTVSKEGNVAQLHL